MLREPIFELSSPVIDPDHVHVTRRELSSFTS
jgi:hypothetical protein